MTASILVSISPDHTLDIQQQEFAFPGTYDAAKVLHFFELYVLVGFNELLAHRLFKRLGVVQFIECFIEIDWKRVGVAIG